MKWRLKRASKEERRNAATRNPVSAAKKTAGIGEEDLRAKDTQNVARFESSPTALKNTPSPVCTPRHDRSGEREYQ